MTRTKFTGVYYRDTLQKDRVYYIQYKQAGRLKRQKVGTKSEGITPLYCKKLRDETLVKLRLGENAPIKNNSKVKTLADVSQEFFKREDLKSKSKMQSLYNTHLAHFENEQLSYFDDDAITKLINKKSKEKSKKTKRVLSEQTVNNILGLLSSILHFAKNKGYTKILPKIRKLKVDNKRERYLTRSEITILMEELEISPLVRKRERLILFVNLALVTGARLGSILGIKGKDINRENKSITIKNFKTNSTYTAFIPDSVMALIPHIKHQELLFDISDAKQLQRPLQGILNKLFNSDLKAYDRKERVVIHTFRHTFASHLAINGTPIQTIMKLMDHRDIDMTLRYSKLMPNSGRSDVENLYG